MTFSPAVAERTAVFNVPNQITLTRLALSIVLVGLITTGFYRASLAVFVIAAGTDWLDGFLARRWNQVSQLGRMLDPFVDKIIICGTFICLVADRRSHVSAWMVVVIVGRELLVTALRSFLESEGADFSASLSGKLKMVLQCLAAAMCLYSLARVAGGVEPSAMFLSVLVGVLWATVAVTVYSGGEYVWRAVVLLRARAASGRNAAGALPADAGETA